MQDGSSKWRALELREPNAPIMSHDEMRAREGPLAIRILSLLWRYYAR